MGNLNETETAVLRGRVEMLMMIRRESEQFKRNLADHPFQGSRDAFTDALVPGIVNMVLDKMEELHLAVARKMGITLEFSASTENATACKVRVNSEVFRHSVSAAESSGDDPDWKTLMAKAKGMRS